MRILLDEEGRGSWMEPCRGLVRSVDSSSLITQIARHQNENRICFSAETVADYFSRLFRGRVRVLPSHRLSDPPSSSVLAHPRSPCGRILILGGNLDGSWRPRSPWWGRENGLIRNRPPVLVRACATPRSAALGHPPWRRCDWSGRWHMAQPVTSPRNVGPRGA